LHLSTNFEEQNSSNARPEKGSAAVLRKVFVPKMTPERPPAAAAKAATAAITAATTTQTTMLRAVPLNDCSSALQTSLPA